MLPIIPEQIKDEDLELRSAHPCTRHLNRDPILGGYDGSCLVHDEPDVLVTDVHALALVQWIGQP